MYFFNGKVLFLLGLAAGVFSIAGNLLGAAAFTRKGSKLICTVILTVLAVFFVKTLTELF